MARDCGYSVVAVIITGGSTSGAFEVEGEEAGKRVLFTDVGRPAIRGGNGGVEVAVRG